MKSQFGFLKRYLWIIGLIAQAAFVAWCFAIFGSIFSSMPRNYQWILAILTPLIQIAANKFTLKVAYQSADPSSKGKSTTKLTSIHYMTIRFEVFMSVLIGSFATKLSRNIIIVIQYIKFIYSGVKIIQKYKHKNVNVNMEGNKLCLF